MRRQLLAGLLAPVLLVPACSSEPKPPRVYPVKGTVAFTDGQPVSKGLIEFKSLEEQAPTSVGNLGPDGSFTLATLANSRKYPGAREGPHQVIVHLPINPDQTGGGTVTLPEQLTVEPREKEGNQFTIKIERPTPAPR